LPCQSTPYSGMNRSVYLGELSVDVTDGRTVITPNEKAAATLDVDHASLESLAREVVGPERIANPLLVWRKLREAVEEALGSRDSAGTARSLLPIIPELFRSGAELDHMPNSKRARRIMNVAKGYRGKLRELGVLDPAEVLQEASRLRPERRAVALGGYPRLGRDELAFLEAVAGVVASSTSRMPLIACSPRTSPWGPSSRGRAGACSVARSSGYGVQRQVPRATCTLTLTPRSAERSRG
jgi:hypothetical protein